MDNKKKLYLSEHLQGQEGIVGSEEEPPLNVDISTMRDVLTQFKTEIEESEEDLSIIFHISILWPSSITNPGIKVSIRLKDQAEEDDVASWERMMHYTDSTGWEFTLAQILKSVKEMDIEFLILQSADAPSYNKGWLQ